MTIEQAKDVDLLDIILVFRNHLKTYFVLFLLCALLLWLLSAKMALNTGSVEPHKETISFEYKHSFPKEKRIVFEKFLLHFLLRPEQTKKFMSVYLPKDLDDKIDENNFSFISNSLNVTRKGFSIGIMTSGENEYDYQLIQSIFETMLVGINGEIFSQVKEIQKKSVGISIGLAQLYLKFRSAGSGFKNLEVSNENSLDVHILSLLAGNVSEDEVLKFVTQYQILLSEKNLYDSEHNRIISAFGYDFVKEIPIPELHNPTEVREQTVESHGVSKKMLALKILFASSLLALLLTIVKAAFSQFMKDNRVRLINILTTGQDLK